MNDMISKLVAEMVPDDYRACLRSDLSAVIARTFEHLNPHTGFLPNWHFDLIASRLQRVLDGDVRRLIINIPPRNGKTISVSVAFVAFILGHDPNAHILAITYAQKLSEKNARDLKSVMNSEWYKSTFPTRLSRDKQTADEFVTTAGGSYFATSMTGVITGRGADFIIIDDPLKPAEAMSDVQRTAVNESFDRTIASRLNDKRTGRIVVVMQRLHEDDLVGHVREQEDWDVLSLPAIAEADERYIIQTPFGAYEQVRREGEPLHAEREPVAILDRLRRSLGELNFAGQYQQRPAPADGGLIKATWFKYYNDSTLPEEFEVVLQSWDTASKASELSDYSVCTTWGLKDKCLYLLDVFRARLLYPQLRRAVGDLSARFSPDVILIEDKGSGTQLIQELQYEGGYGVRAYDPVKDKKVRLSVQTGFFEGGFVYFPEKAPWLSTYVSELLLFPNAKHDDQVDSTAQALDWFKKETMSSAHVWIEYYRGLAIEAGVDPEKIRSIDERRR